MIPPTLLLQGYRQGLFPMAMDDGELAWFSPDPRGILPIEDFRVPHGLRRVLRRQPFAIYIDCAFEKVMRACAARAETWISTEIIASYCALHRLGYAHSVEAWQGDELVGGLYGVAIGGAFFGESMFHSATDASKVALHALVQRLQQRRFRLLDIQWVTPHLQLFGAIEIPRDEYMTRLKSSVRLQRQFSSGEPELVEQQQL